MNRKEIVSRALKTFVEAAVGYALVSLGDLAAMDGDMSLLPNTIACVLISAVAAGISAVWNGVIEPLFKKGE